MRLIRICRFCSGALGDTAGTYDAHMSVCASAPDHVRQAAVNRLLGAPDAD